MLLLYLKMPTIIMNNLKLDCVLSTTIITKTNILFLNLILLSVLSLVSINSQNFNHANASTSLGESIKQFQENLQSNINKQIQSSTNNNNNNNNCDNNNKNNFNTKNDIATITSSPANSVDNGINSPLYAETNSNDQMVSTTQKQQKGHDLISYSLSDFNINSIIRQNSDTTFVGKMDVVKETKSMDTNRLLKKDAFYNVGASLSILNNRVVIINFDSQTTLFNDFKYTPLVG